MCFPVAAWAQKHLVLLSFIYRFVNSYVDVEQKKMYAESIAIIAQRIGIPSEVVDCRHRITHHEDLPSLTLLRYFSALRVCF